MSAATKNFRRDPSLLPPLLPSLPFSLLLHRRRGTRGGSRKGGKAGRGKRWRKRPRRTGPPFHPFNHAAASLPTFLPPLPLLSSHVFPPSVPRPPLPPLLTPHEHRHERVQLFNFPPFLPPALPPFPSPFLPSHPQATEGKQDKEKLLVTVEPPSRRGGREGASERRGVSVSVRVADKP